VRANCARNCRECASMSVEKFDSDRAAAEVQRWLDTQELLPRDVAKLSRDLGCPIPESSIREALVPKPRRPITQKMFERLLHVVGPPDLRLHASSSSSVSRQPSTVYDAMYGNVGFTPLAIATADGLRLRMRNRIIREGARAVVGKEELLEALVALLDDGASNADALVIAQLTTVNLAHGLGNGAGDAIPFLISQLVKSGCRVDQIISSPLFSKMDGSKFPRFVELARQPGDYTLGVFPTSGPDVLPSLVVRPGIGALVVHYLEDDEYLPNNGLWFSAAESPDIVDHLYRYGLFLQDQSTQPFGTIDKSSGMVDAAEVVKLESALITAESTAGDRFLIKHGFSDLTIPADVYRWFLVSSRRPATSEDKAIIRLRHRRYAQFGKHLNRSAYVDFVPRSAFESYVRNGEYAPGYGVIHGKVAAPGDRVQHLENIIDQMRKFPTYTVLVVDDELLGMPGEHAMAGDSLLVKSGNNHDGEWGLMFESRRTHEGEESRVAFETHHPVVRDSIDPILLRLRARALRNGGRDASISLMERALKDM